MTAPVSPDERGAVREAARTHDVDRYLAALLAPRAVRDDLVTLAAFAGEIARVPRTVAEPMIGEIRLQWWSDALAEAGNPHLEPQRTGHPVADALADVVRRRGLDVADLQAAIDARRHDMYADAPSDAAALMVHLQAAHGGLLRQAVRIVRAATTSGRAVPSTLSPSSATAPLSASGSRAVTAAAAAYGLARTLVDLPLARARGRNPFPGAAPPPSLADAAPWCAEARTHLAQARAHIAAANPDERAALRIALLPVALVEPYLRAFESAGARALDESCDVLPLRRAWALLAARHIRRL